MIKLQYFTLLATPMVKYSDASDRQDLQLSEPLVDNVDSRLPN